MRRWRKPERVRSGELVGRRTQGVHMRGNDKEEDTGQGEGGNTKQASTAA